MGNAALEELIQSWLAARARGVDLPLDELCRSHPELTEAVRARIKTLAPDTLVASSGTSLQASTLHSEPSRSTPTTLGGYRIERVLGEGGMGTVYLAHDDRARRPVALKTIRPELVAKPEIAERFRREARAAAQLVHDNIVPIWHVGEDAGIPFIAMPLLHGESLAERLDRDSVPPLRLTVKVGREVAEGLAAAHEKGLIHRDVKPANIWLEGDLTTTEEDRRVRRVKILDFGLARPSSEDTQITGSGVIVGTPAF